MKTVKVIVSGDGGVGKTSFLDRLVNDSFYDDNKLTRGVDFYSKNITVNGVELNFIMWDFAGQAQFKTLLKDFVSGSIAAVILPILLIGTKNDLITPSDTQAIDDYIIDIVNGYENIITYLKISSKTGENIKNAFEILIGSLCL